MENLNKNDVSRRPGSAQTEAPDPRSSGLPARPLRTRTRSGGPAVKKQPEQTNKPSIPNLKQGVRSEGSPATRREGLLRGGEAHPVASGEQKGHGSV